MATRRQVSIYINGRQVENSIKGITAEKRKLNRELRNMVVGSEEYEQKIQEYRKLDPILKSHRDRLRGISRESQAAAKEAGGMQAAFQKLVGGGISRFAGIAAGAFAVDTIVQYGSELFKLGSEMELLGQKAETVWGEALPKVSAAARQNASDIGLTEGAYIDAATAMGDLLKPLGFTTEEAAKLSTESLNLAGALSEWTGGMFSATEVNGSFQKALLGSREELERYGINIKQSDVNNRLAEKGLSDLTGEMLKQAEAAATLELITEQSVDAQRAFATSTGSLVREQAKLNAKLETIRENIANALVPSFGRLISVASGFVDVIADYTSLSLADQLEEERIELNLLVSQITDTNIAQEDRNALIQQLQTQYPDFLGNLDAETVTNEQLGKRLQEVNDQYIFRIALQREDEKIQKAAQAVAERQTAVAEKELEIRQKIIKFNEEWKLGLDLTNRTLEEQIELTREALIANDAAGEGYRAAAGLAASGQKVLQERLQGSKAELESLQAFREELRQTLQEQLGISDPTEPNNNATSQTPETSPTSEEIAQQKARAQKLAEERQKQREKELQEQQKQLERLQEMTANFREIARLEALDADEQELERIRIKYEEQIALANELEAKGIEEATAIAAELEVLKQQAIQEAIFDQNEKFIEEQEALIDKELDSIVDAEARKTEVELEAVMRRNALKKQEQEKQLAFERQLAEARMELASAEITLAQSVGQQLSQVLGDSAGLQKGFFLFEKTLAAAQVIIELQKQTALISTKYALIPGGQFLAAAEIANARIRAATSLVTIAGTTVGEFIQRKEGGWLNAKGADDGKSYRAMYFGQPSTGMLPNHPVLLDSVTGQRVLASERGQEYFVSNESLKNPVVLNYVKAIDNIQRGGVPQYQEGGFTAPPQDASAPAAPQGISPQQIQQMTAAITLLNNTLRSGIYAVIDDDSVVDLRNRTQKLVDASGGVL